MKQIALALTLFFMLPALALADGGGGVVGSGALDEMALTYTKLQTSTIEVFEYEGDTEIDNLGIDFGDSDFINNALSIAATTIALVFEKAGVSIWVMGFIALLALIWLFGVVVARQVEARQEAIENISQRISQSRIGRFLGRTGTGVRGVYRTGRSVHRLSGGGGGFRRRRE